MNQNFSSVTETGDEKVSCAQIERMVQRYFWAGEFCQNKDVLEVACGIGQGLGYLASVSKSVQAGDITPDLVKKALEHYGERIKISEMDAQCLPFGSECLDVIIMFEAIYYLTDVERFINECWRVLRPGGVLLLATANKDLFDFNPSPYSVRYYNPPELDSLLSARGFHVNFWGGSPVDTQRFLNKVMRLLKKIAVKFSLIPGSMRGKQWLKRIVFGELVPMPKELKADGVAYVAPIPIDRNSADTRHQVLYCVAKKVIS